MPRGGDKVINHEDYQNSLPWEPPGTYADQYETRETKTTQFVIV